jgi:uncharacterized coiled-coil protein SlyX
MDDRLTRLEILFMEQGRLLEDLSAEMARQQREIRLLTGRLERLEEKLAALEEPNDIRGPERPPHY